MIVNQKCGMCQAGCQVNITVENGKITRVEPDKTSPRGRVCVRGALSPQILYSPDRLTYPLIRDGEKGEGKFRRASWEEALDYAANLLRETSEKYGANSLASYQGRGILGRPISRVMNPTDKQPSFIQRLGSPNFYNVLSICYLASNTVTPTTTTGLVDADAGFDKRFMAQDFEHCDYIFSWGKDPTTDDGPQMIIKAIKRAQERGAKLVVIDPRQTGIGELADLWVPIIPGSDGALALAMLKIIIETKRYDENFVQNFTKGFDVFCEYLDTLTLEQLSKWCGISIELIQKLTDIFCSTPKITLVSYTGLEYQLSGIQNGRAILTLWAITGKLDVEGSIYFSCENLPTFQPKELPTENKPVGLDEFPLLYKFIGGGQFCCFPKAVLEDDPYPVRGLIVAGGSPVLTFPESETWREAYRKLDCLIVLDRFMTEDARFADVIFPTTTIFESYSPVQDSDGKISLINPVISPVGECKDDAFILFELARRLGIGDDYPKNEEEFKDWLCEEMPHFSTYISPKNNQPRIYKKYETGQLRKDGKPGFPTPSGKFEICSTLLEENGFTPYPEYVDIHSIPELNCPEFPFILTTGARSKHRMGALGANIPGVAKVEPYPCADISTEDAKEFGIEEGDSVKVTTPFGEAVFKAHLCGMAAHCIHVPHGGGSYYMPEEWKNGNANALTSLRYSDPITGYATVKSVPCKIEKCV